VSDDDDPVRQKKDRIHPVGPAKAMQEPGIIDVRGKAADDAIEMLESILDQAALGGTSLIRVIHGHGSGRLRQVLRDYLKGSPYVNTFRPGERAEGGDGVTVVTLK
jgi:DNA mismatch repair protein MutS2